MMSLPVWNSEAIGSIIKHKNEIYKKDDDPMADIPVWKRELLKRKQAQASRTFLVSPENSKDNSIGNVRYSRCDSLSSYTSNDLNALPFIRAMATPNSSSASSLNEEYIEPKETSSKSGLMLINLEENPWIKAERQLGIKSTQGFRQRHDDHKLKTADKPCFNAGSTTFVGSVNKDYVDRDRGTTKDNRMKNFVPEEPDYEVYGPGIVNKLKYKYISLTLAAESGDSYMKLKRSSSLENLLENKREPTNDKIYQTNSLQRRLSKKGLSQKKSYSVENLFDGLIGDSLKKSRGDPLSLLANENVVIIEAAEKKNLPLESPKAEIFLSSPISVDGGLSFKISGSKEVLLDELPKPNTVQTYKSIFESTVEKEKQKVKPIKKKIGDAKSSDKVKSSAKKDNIPRPPTPRRELDAKILKLKSPPKDSVAFEPQVAAAQAAFDVKLKSVTAMKLKDSVKRSLPQNTSDEFVKTSILNSLSGAKSELITINNEKNKKNIPIKSAGEILSDGKSNVSIISNGTILPKKESDAQIESVSDSTNSEPPTDVVVENLNQKSDSRLPENVVNSPAESDSTEVKKIKETVKGAKPFVSQIEQSAAPIPIKRRAPPPPGTTVILEIRNGTVQTNSSIPGLSDASNTLSHNNHNIQLNQLHDNPVTNIDDLVPNIDGSSRYSNLTIADDYTYENGDCVYRIPEPCGIQFEGENVILEKSNILKNKNKNLKIQFDDDAVSMYEYPSEESLAEEYDEFYGSEDQTTGHSDNPAFSSLGGISSYTPSSLVSEGFELGVEPTWEPPPVIAKQSEEPPTDEFLVKPGEDADMHTWSSSNSMDLLF